MRWEVRTMASGTSYFNGTLYRKAMGRFWPLWALWGMIWLFAGPLLMLNSYFNVLSWNSRRSAQADLLSNACHLPAGLELGVWLAAVFGVLCAMAVFGYLYNTRSACMMHALPVRREGLFITQYLAGLSALLLPLAAVGLLTLAVELAFLPSSDWGQALGALAIWLFGMMGISLFFFSFAAFCAMFTGHILALPAFYGILNCLVITIHDLAAHLMSEFFYGYIPVLENSWVTALTPAYALTKACRSSLQYKWLPDDTLVVQSCGVQSPQGIAVYAAAGVVLALAALAVYRRRHVETAGDVVSVSLVRPIFKYGVALCSGLSLGTFTATFFGWNYDSHAPLIASALVWTAAGYFVAEMLLKKSFRVFRAWKGCAAAVAVMALLCAVCAFDLLGVETRVPDPSQVAKLEMATDLGSTRSNQLTCTADNQALMEKITQFHRAIVNQKEQFEHGAAGDDFTWVSLTYTLENGSVLRRRYDAIPLNKEELDQEGSVTWCADQLSRSQELWEKMYDFDDYEQGQLSSVYIDEVYDIAGDSFNALQFDLSTSQLMKLWAAVRADFEAGDLGARPLFADERESYLSTLEFEWLLGQEDQPRSWETLIVTLNPHMTHTLACLEELDALGGNYQLLDQYGNPVE